MQGAAAASRPHLSLSSPPHLETAGPALGRSFVDGGARPGGERGAGSRAGEVGQRLKIPHGMKEDPAAATEKAAAPPEGCRRVRGARGSADGGPWPSGVGSDLSPAGQSALLQTHNRRRPNLPGLVSVPKPRVASRPTRGLSSHGLDAPVLESRAKSPARGSAWAGRAAFRWQGPAPAVPGCHPCRPGLLREAAGSLACPLLPSRRRERGKDVGSCKVPAMYCDAQGRGGVVAPGAA